MPSSIVLRLRELPRTERPRERLRDLGAHALSTSELLAIVIGSGTPQRSALVLAQDALAKSDGSLRRLASLPVAALTSVHGLGSVRAVAIHAALELGRWYAFRGRYELAIELLTSARSAGANVSSLLLGRCYWQAGRKADAVREFRIAADNAADAQEKFYLSLCISRLAQGNGEI